MITYLLVLLLAFVMGCFFLQVAMAKKYRIDAGLVFGFIYFFEGIGFLYQRYTHQGSLLLLLGLPLLPVLFSLYNESQKPDDRFAHPGLGLWFLFVSYSIVSLAWASNDSGGVAKEQILFIHGIIPGICAYIVYKRYRIFSWTGVAIFGLMYGIVHQIYGRYPMDYPGRLTLPGGNPIFDARLLFAAVTIAIWGTKIPLIVRLATIGVGIYSGMATQSRGPLLAFVAANLLVLAYVCLKKYKEGHFRISPNLVLGSAFLAMAAGLAIWNQIGTIQAEIGQSRFNIFVSSSQLTADANYTGRQDLQQFAVSQFVENPFFGTGLGGNSEVEYPHNIILEIASELGLVGISLWSIAFLVSLFAAKQSAILLVLIIQTFSAALFSGDLGYNYEYLLIALVAFAMHSPDKAGFAIKGESI